MDADDYDADWANHAHKKERHQFMDRISELEAQVEAQRKLLLKCVCHDCGLPTIGPAYSPECESLHGEQS